MNPETATVTSGAPPGDSLAALLAQLHDLREPPAVSLWPATPAWAVLGVMLAAGLAVGLRLWWRHRQAGAYRRAALAELRGLEPDLTRGGGAALAALDTLLRRTALAAYPRAEVAALSGQGWADFLATPAARVWFPMCPPWRRPPSRASPRPLTGWPWCGRPGPGSGITMLEFAQPIAVLALPLPLLVWWLAPPRRAVVEALRFPFFDRVSQGLKTGEGAVVLPRRWLQVAAVALLWALAIGTVARPEWLGAPVTRTEAARDIMLAVDISGSMATRDFIGADGTRAARLDGVGRVLDGFIAARTQDRIGLVVFGSAPYVLVPFTRDTAAARYLLGTLTPGMAGQNTVLGDAVGLAIQSFAASQVEERVLIVLSDGTDTSSRMAPAKAADIAARNGVTIHTIAVGDPGAGAEDKVDTATLQAMAEATGGTFQRAEDAAGLAAIYDRIDAIHPVQGRTLSWRPRLALTPWVAGAFVGMVVLGYAGLLLRAALRRPVKAAP